MAASDLHILKINYYISNTPPVAVSASPIPELIFPPANPEK
jgi:hypothetical protein